MKAIDLSKIPYQKEMRAVSDYLTPVAVILLHVYALLALFLYGGYAVSFLVKMEVACMVAILLLQCYRIRRIWLWVVFLINGIMLLVLNSRHDAGKTILLYFALVIALLVFKQIAVSRSVFLTIHLLLAIGMTYFLGMSEPSALFTDYYLVLGKQLNPNFIGILGLACMMHWMCFFNMLRVKGFYRFLGQFCSAVLGLHYIFESKCRSALLGAAVFLVLYLIWWRPFSRRFYQVITVGTILVMLVFPNLYLRMAESAAEEEILGKHFFTGREAVWSEALPIIRENLLFGVGTSVEISSHHALLELMLVLGILPVITFILLSARPDGRAASHEVSRLAQMAFVGCLFVGIFESLFTIQYLYIFFLSFLLSAVEKETAGDARA